VYVVYLSGIRDKLDEAAAHVVSETALRADESTAGGISRN